MPASGVISTMPPDPEGPTQGLARALEAKVHAVVADERFRVTGGAAARKVAWRREGAETVRRRAHRAGLRGGGRRPGGDLRRRRTPRPPAGRRALDLRPDALRAGHHRTHPSPPSVADQRPLRRPRHRRLRLRHPGRPPGGFEPRRTPHRVLLGDAGGRAGAPCRDDRHGDPELQRRGRGVPGPPDGPLPSGQRGGHRTGLWAASRDHDQRLGRPERPDHAGRGQGSADRRRRASAGRSTPSTAPISPPP